MVNVSTIHKSFVLRMVVLVAPLQATTLWEHRSLRGRFVLGRSWCYDYDFVRSDAKLFGVLVSSKIQIESLIEPLCKSILHDKVLPTNFDPRAKRISSGSGNCNALFWFVSTCCYSFRIGSTAHLARAIRTNDGCEDVGGHCIGKTRLSCSFTPLTKKHTLQTIIGSSGDHGWRIWNIHSPVLNLCFP